MASEPDLPCTKKVSPIKTQIESIPDGDLTSPASATSENSVSSPVRMGLYISKNPGEQIGPSGSKIVLVNNETQMKRDLKKKPGLVLNPPKLAPYGEWKDRFVSQYLPVVADCLPHLQSLSLCGCHISHGDFVLVLSGLSMLTNLDISYSTLKTESISSIAQYCRHRLEKLDISGIFKFGRNRGHSIVAVTAYCQKLSLIIAKDCPELYPEVIEECLAVSIAKVQIITDEQPEQVTE
jgi:hypothetical protein